MTANSPVAAIDCGTNSMRLLVLAPDGSRITRLMRITRLGAGVDRTGALDPAAVERNLATLREYRRVIDEAGVAPVRIRATATSAARDASNAGDFLGPANEILGGALTVIEGAEEGRLSYEGATASLDPAGGPYVVMDVGGGSTELVASGRSPSSTSLWAISLDMGCVRATERFLYSDPPTASEITAARAATRALVEQAVADVPALRSARQLVGLAGTVSALAVLALGLDGYDERRVHHARVTRDQVESLTAELATMPLSARRERHGMERERADVIVGGAIVVGEVMAGLGSDELIASEADILDGIALELLGLG